MEYFKKNNNNDLYKIRQKQRSKLFDLDEKLKTKKNTLYLLEKDALKLKRADKKKREKINEEKTKLFSEIHKIESDMPINHENILYLSRSNISRSYLMICEQISEQTRERNRTRKEAN